MKERETEEWAPDDTMQYQTILYYTIPYDTVQYNTITGNQAENKHFSEGKGGMGDTHIEMEAMWEI